MITIHLCLAHFTKKITEFAEKYLQGAPSDVKNVSKEILIDNINIKSMNDAKVWFSCICTIFLHETSNEKVDLALNTVYKFFDTNSEHFISHHDYNHYLNMNNSKALSENKKN